MKAKYLDIPLATLKATLFQRISTIFLFFAIYSGIVAHEVIDAWISRNNPIKEFFITRGGSRNGNRINFRTEYYLGETVLHQGRRGKVVVVGVADRPHEIVYTVDVDGKRIYDLKGSELSSVKE
ncbi:MAG: hypothetical protein JXR78_16785 [Victivallales bacterium]|nr:hypothetical protein [Victivallales bacterium]